MTQVKDNEDEDDQDNQIVVNDNMIERYRGKSENKVSVLDANENGHYNSKTLTNQYIIKGMTSGKSKEAMRRNTDTQEGADEQNQSPDLNEPVRETQRNSRVSGIHPFDSNNQINNDTGMRKVYEPKQLPLNFPFQKASDTDSRRWHVLITI